MAFVLPLPAIFVAPKTLVIVVFKTELGFGSATLVDGFVWRPRPAVPPNAIKVKKVMSRKAYDATRHELSKCKQSFTDFKVRHLQQG